MKNFFQFLRETPIVWVPILYIALVLTFFKNGVMLRGWWAVGLWATIATPFVIGITLAIYRLYRQWEEEQAERKIRYRPSWNYCPDCNLDVPADEWNTHLLEHFEKSNPPDR